jgi:hypothetical protein
MRKLIVLSGLLCLLLLAVSSASAGSPVWKVSKDGNRLFVGGTIHVLSQADYPLPAAFEAAYQQAALVVLETDLQQMKAPATQQKLLQTMLYTDGRTLQQALNRQTFAELEQYLAGRGMPITAFQRFKPGLLALTLTMIELQRLGLGEAGVDAVYHAKALADRKQLGQLESVDQQLGFIASLGEGQENEMISHTLRDLKELPAVMQALKGSWRDGDIRKLDQLSLAPLKAGFPALYDTLIVTRNRAWIPQLEALLQTGEVELVLVGALHLVGDDGVLALLSKRGYTVQQLD